MTDEIEAIRQANEEMRGRLLPRERGGDAYVARAVAHIDRLLEIITEKDDAAEVVELRVELLREIIAEKDQQAAALLKHCADTIERKADIIAEKDLAITKCEAEIARLRHGSQAVWLGDISDHAFEGRKKT